MSNTTPNIIYQFNDTASPGTWEDITREEYEEYESILKDFPDNGEFSIRILYDHPHVTGQTLHYIMECNDWRSALIGLCIGSDKDVNTPYKAAEHIRERIKRGK
jgi:hypothetical protein